MVFGWQFQCGKKWLQFYQKLYAIIIAVINQCEECSKSNRTLTHHDENGAVCLFINVFHMQRYFEALTHQWIAVMFIHQFRIYVDEILWFSCFFFFKTKIKIAAPANKCPKRKTNWKIVVWTNKLINVQVRYTSEIYTENEKLKLIHFFSIHGHRLLSFVLAIVVIVV